MKKVYFEEGFEPGGFWPKIERYTFLHENYLVNEPRALAVGL